MISLDFFVLDALKLLFKASKVYFISLLSDFPALETDVLKLTTSDFVRMESGGASESTKTSVPGKYFGRFTVLE